MVGQRPGQAIASEHFTLPGIWKDTCRAHGPNGMCLVHDYPFYECALMVWRMHATIKGLTRVTILRTDDKYWRDQAHARWIAAHPEFDGLADAEAFVTGWQTAVDELRDDTLRQAHEIRELKDELKILSAGKLMWALDAQKAHAEAEGWKREYDRLLERLQELLGR